MRRTVFLFLLMTALVSAQTQPVHSQKPNKSIRHSNTENTPSEEKLRLRLQFNPHDAAAHKQLIELLGKKNAFRAIVIEDANWLSNNRNDSFALIELVSYAETALHDPEYAISQLRFQLSSVSRQDDAYDFDDWSDQLAAKLQKRGRPEEALPLLSELVRLNPNEAGFWADYADNLSALDRNEEAEKAYRRAITLDPSMESFHEGFAEALLKSRDLSGATSEYRAALSLYDAQYKTGEATDSFHSFIRNMVKIEQKFGAEHALSETRLKLARVLLMDKKYEEAIAQTQAAMDADHTNFIALYLCAEIYEAKGDHEQATRTRDNAKSLIEKEAAKEHVEKGKGAVAAVDPRVIFLQDSLSNEPFSHPALPSEVVSILEPRLANLSNFERLELATAYFALGQVESGKRQWELAMAADPDLNNPVSNFSLGEELVRAGDLAGALPHLQRAYELDPQNTTYRMDFDAIRQHLAR